MRKNNRRKWLCNLKRSYFGNTYIYYRKGLQKPFEKIRKNIKLPAIVNVLSPFCKLPCEVPPFYSSINMFSCIAFMHQVNTFSLSAMHCTLQWITNLRLHACLFCSAWCNRCCMGQPFAIYRIIYCFFFSSSWCLLLVFFSLPWWASCCLRHFLKALVHET